MGLACIIHVIKLRTDNTRELLRPLLYLSFACCMPRPLLAGCFTSFSSLCLRWASSPRAGFGRAGHDCFSGPPSSFVVTPMGGVHWAAPVCCPLKASLRLSCCPSTDWLMLLWVFYDPQHLFRFVEGLAGFSVSDLVFGWWLTSG